MWMVCCLCFNFISSWLIAAWSFWDLAVKMIIPVQKGFFLSKIRLILIYLFFFYWDHCWFPARKKEKTQNNSETGIEYRHMSCLWAFLLVFIPWIYLFIFCFRWPLVGWVSHDKYCCNHFDGLWACYVFLWLNKIIMWTAILFYYDARVL